MSVKSTTNDIENRYDLGLVLNTDNNDIIEYVSPDNFHVTKSDELTPSGFYQLSDHTWNFKFYVFGKVPCLFRRICMKIFFGFNWHKFD